MARTKRTVREGGSPTGRRTKKKGKKMAQATTQPPSMGRQKKV